VLDHPGKLPTEATNLLAGCCGRAPLVYVAAEPIDATNLKLLVDARVRICACRSMSGRRPVGRPRRNLALTAANYGAAPVSVFGESAAALLEPLRFQGGLVSRRLDEGWWTMCGRATRRTAGLGCHALRAARCGVERGPGASDCRARRCSWPLLGELVRLLHGTQRQADATWRAANVALTAAR